MVQSFENPSKKPLCQSSKLLVISKLQFLFLMPHKTTGSSAQLPSLSATAWIFASVLKGEGKSKCYFIPPRFFFLFFFFSFFSRTLSLHIFATRVALQHLQTVYVFSPLFLVILRGKITLQQVIPPLPEAEFSPSLCFEH